MAFMATNLLGVSEREEVSSKPRDAAPLFDRAIGAFTWRFLSESSIFALRLVVTIILARLLPVDAFGLLTLVMIVMNFAYRISQVGMAPALIQCKDLTKTHARVAFSVSVLSGVAITAVIWASAPAVAAIFRNDAVTPLLRLISTSFLFSSLGSISAALLERRLNYRRLFQVELSSYTFGYALVGIILAVSGWGVWALAWAIVVESVLRAGLLFAASPHPLRPSFARLEAGQLLNFGAGSSLSRIANYAALNGDYFVVGRWLGAEDLGLYSRAYQLISLPMYQFSSVISYVLFPVYSRIQDDTRALRRAYIASVFISSVIVIPILTALAIAAPEVMAGVFGPQWTGAIAPLQLLCMGGVFHSIYNLGDSLARAKGAVYLKFWCHAVYAAGVIVGSIVGTSWGINGVAVGVVMALAVIYLLLGRLSIYLSESTWREFFLSQLPGLIFGVSVAAFALPVTLLLRSAQIPHLVILAATLAMSLIGALLAALVLPRPWLNRISLGAIDRLKRYSSDNLKPRLKAYLSHKKKAFKAAEVIYDNLLTLRHIIQNGLWRDAAGLRHPLLRRPLCQAPMTWEVPFPVCGSPDELINWLKAQGVEVSEGGHTFYIPPQERLSDIIPTIVGFYPPGTGFKVLKDFRHPSRARYLYRHRNSLILLKRLLGTPQDRLIAANLVYSFGIGPRVWDLACWKAGGKSYSVFIVDHVNGDCPTAQQYVSFLDRLKHLNANSHLRILIPKWEENVDFVSPDCNKNLIYSNRLGRVQYIDFQNFGLRRPDAWSQQIISNANGSFRDGNGHKGNGHKGNGHNGRSENARRLSRFTAGAAVTGGRDAARRWSFVTSALRRSSISLTGRLVLDIGCGSGKVIQSSLAAGAAWAIGWDRPEVVAHSERLLLSLGATRFSLIGADFDQQYRFEDDIPVALRPLLAEGVVFDHSADEPKCAAESLSTMPWRVLVYEGRKSERSEDFATQLKSKINGDLEAITLPQVEFDNFDARPITIFLRR
jgi:PST family polysaccharide transporter